jgi:hypothetical protein
LQPDRRQSMVAFAAALAMLALVAPATSARPVEDFFTPQPPSAAGSAASTARDIASDPGFDWGAAAIGAGVAIALLLLGSMAAIAFIGRGRARVVRETEPAGMPMKARR